MGGVYNSSLRAACTSRLRPSTLPSFQGEGCSLFKTMALPLAASLHRRSLLTRTTYSILTCRLFDHSDSGVVCHHCKLLRILVARPSGPAYPARKLLSRSTHGAGQQRQSRSCVAAVCRTPQRLVSRCPCPQHFRPAPHPWTNCSPNQDAAQRATRVNRSHLIMRPPRIAPRSRSGSRSDQPSTTSRQ